MGTTPHAAYDVRTELLSRTPPVFAKGQETVLTVLVTVKAYPVIGRKTGESVCVAGVSLDQPKPAWVRLFPVPFRSLPGERQFKKYDVVRLRTTPRGGASDRRSESKTPNLESLLKGPHVGTDPKSTWRRRRELLGDLLGQTTTCRLGSDAKARGQAAPSLGLVKPRDVSLTVAPNPDYVPGGEDVAVDEDLFGNERAVLEKTPFIATYHYFCEGASACRGHSPTLIDWESGALARKLLVGHDQKTAMALHQEKFLDQLCGPDKDTYFYVGNQHQHPASFLVLGIFSPKRGGTIDTPLELDF